MRAKQYKIKPIITEKSTKLAEKGQYTFAVSPELSKNQAKSLINEIYKVEVGKVRSEYTIAKEKRSFKGGRFVHEKYQRRAKKVIVELKKGKDTVAKLFKL